LGVGDLPEQTVHCPDPSAGRECFREAPHLLVECGHHQHIRANAARICSRRARASSLPASQSLKRILRIQK